MDFQEVLMFELNGNYSKLDLNKIESVEALRLFDNYDDPVHIRWPNFIEDMKDISKELDDLTADKLPIELKKIYSIIENSQNTSKYKHFITLSLTYSNGRYTDFIRSYMYFELMRRNMLAEMEEICRDL